MSRAIHSSIGFRNDVAKQMGSGSKPLQIPLLDSVQSGRFFCLNSDCCDVLIGWSSRA